jgi:4-carboxymuconolactone decarboxylase
MKRLPAPDRSTWSEQTRNLLGDMPEPGVDSADQSEAMSGGAPNILLTISHHPRLLVPFLGFTATLALRGVLTRRDSEILALRAAWNCNSPFEWGHHVLYGRAAGLSEEEIERIADGPEVEGWGARDRLLLRAADQLHERKTIDDPTWKALTAEFENAQLVELPFVVGNYTMLSMVANATDVPLEPDLPLMPDRARSGDSSSP